MHIVACSAHTDVRGTTSYKQE